MKIAIIGIGDVGTNIVNILYIKKKIHKKAKLIVSNIDEQSLCNSPMATKILLGKTTTGGLGAGGNSDMGKTAAQENIAEIGQQLCDLKVVIICAGFGGGTGTEATPIIA